MSLYMIDIQLPDDFTQDFIELIPYQRALIDQLMNEGKILTYSLAANRSKLWVIVDANNRHEVYNILSGFPIFDFIKSTVSELAFHNHAEQGTLQFSLN